MTTELTWLGHGGWAIKTGEHRVLVDPFLTDSPTAPLRAADVQADFILISHGHFDHVADVVQIAKRTGAMVVANFEICQWLAGQGVENATAMNLGGSVSLPVGRVKMVLALHSSALPDGSYGGNPSGFVVTLEGKNIYFACDTGLFGDMHLIGREGIDVAVLPIGDLYTMGPGDALEAVKLISPKRVVPAHYNTWPPIAQDADAWAKRVREETSAEPVILQPGERLTL